ncbi:MAG: hypothetical protein ACTTJC_02680 [Campylobacter sp.]
MKFKKFNNAKTLSLASLLCVQNPNLANLLKQNKYLYISCLEDEILGNENLIRCEIGSISYVLALLCKFCLNFDNFDGEIKEYFSNLDEGFLSGECNVGEEEFENEISPFFKECDNIIIDSSFFRHKDSAMIFKFLDLLGKNVVLASGDTCQINIGENLNQLSELDNFDGSVVFVRDGKSDVLVGSNSFAMIAKIKDGDLVEIVANGLNLQRKFSLNTNMQGTIALCEGNFSGYDFKLAKITKIG